MDTLTDTFKLLQDKLYPYKFNVFVLHFWHTEWKVYSWVSPFVCPISKTVKELVHNIPSVLTPVLCGVFDHMTM